MAVVLAACLCMPSQPVRADEAGELDDAVARAQYAFFTGDARSLEQALTLIDKIEVPTSLNRSKEYYAAYGRWKLAQLYVDAATQPRGDKGAARSAASKAALGCIQHAETMLRLDPRLAEGYAIAAACAGVQSSGSCLRSKSLRTALELAPANPRVRLIEAICSAGGDNHSPVELYDKLRGVVTAFDAAPVSRPGNPDWGQAEALVLLGQVQLQRGEALAARDMIEKALVIAPDYRKAQELLQAAATRPR
jgi:tetratricopeptide (TPR) repeat protein